MARDTIDDGGLARDKTLRDEYIGIAMAGLLAGRTYECGETVDVDQVMHHAKRFADAAIAEKRQAEVIKSCKTCKWYDEKKGQIGGCLHEGGSYNTCPGAGQALWEAK